MNLQDITFKVCDIAKEVGSFLREERKVFSLDKVEEKRNHDYVSYVDKTAEIKLVEKLQKVCPEAGFVTEEGTVEQSGYGLNWVIDPLDGTTNYIQNISPYCVSIALRDGEELLIGVVYEVCRDECYYAWKDGGAFLNGEGINVSDKNINQAIIGLDVPYNSADYKSVIINVLDKLYEKVAGFRFNGSAAMSLCYVAAGRYDGWAEAYIKPWDYCAGVLLVREAGGVVTDYNGNESILNKHHVIATNGVVHEELRKELPCY